MSGRQNSHPPPPHRNGNDDEDDDPFRRALAANIASQDNGRVIDTSDLDLEEAETQNMARIEDDERRRRSSEYAAMSSFQLQEERLASLFGGEGQSQSSMRSSPASVPSPNHRHTVVDGGTEKNFKAPRLKSAVRRIQMANKLSLQKQVQTSMIQERRMQYARGRHHRRSMSRAQDLLDVIHSEDAEHNQPQSSDRDNRVEPLLAGIMESPSSTDDVGSSEDDGSQDRDNQGDQSDSEDDQDNVLLRSHDGGDRPLLPQRHPVYGSSPTTGGGGRRGLTRQRSMARFTKWKKIKHCCGHYLHPIKILRLIARAVMSSWTISLALPALALAFFLYYQIGNPKLDFMPGDATLAWWILFAARQIVTLDIARLTQWILVDNFMASSFSVKLFGPQFIFFVIQSSGWPFIVTAWGLWDLLLLHGDNTFQAHWFHWTGWRIFSQANSGTYIISSDQYLRILLSLIVLGVATSIKKTMVAYRFGARQLEAFKPKLEKILKDIVLVSEVAVIARHADSLQSVEEIDSNDVKTRTRQQRALQNVDALQAVEFEYESSDDSGSEDDEVQSGKKTPGTESDCESDEDRRRGIRVQSLASSRGLVKSRSGSIRLKDLLDRWEEPVDKSNQSLEATISDVLTFRRLLKQLDENLLFGEAFGPAGTRSECIESSHSVYWRLRKLNPLIDEIPFENICLGAVDDDGAIDEAKVKALRRVFRPDSRDKLPLLDFIQSIDSVYKRLRFFRASVGNGSVIDRVLESIINGLFYFTLGLILLTFMEFNPWPLLVSLTSLLVSVSFALGSSVSKFVEGMLLIAVRRPFELGDRIFFTGAETVSNPGPGASWFVEDINLFSTTLRYAKTNDVSTVSNAAISSSRIVNCNRSPNAIVSFTTTTHIAILKHGKIAKLRAALEKFVQDRPRTWDSLAFMRKDVIDADNELVTFTLAFRHRSSWQDAGKILINKGNLMEHVHWIVKDLGVELDTPPPRRVIYDGGRLEIGSRQDYKSNLLKASNIMSQNRPASTEF